MTRRAVYMKPYRLKPCPYCDGMISNLSRHGNILEEYKYNQRLACHKCKGKAIRMARQPKEFAPVLNKAIDNFIYGRTA